MGVKCIIIVRIVSVACPLLSEVVSSVPRVIRVIASVGVGVVVRIVVDAVACP